MSLKQRDPVTGYLTTGHEWDGIIELNTRVPRVVWWAMGLTQLYAFLAWVLLPAWPLVTTYTGGLLGYDERAELAQTMEEAGAERASWMTQIAEKPADEIRADAALMSYVSDTAPALYADNCSVCHGAKADGGPGFPSLVDSAWLWGGDEEAVMETLRVGINSEHPDTRIAEMLNFGTGQMLEREDIDEVVAYVLSLSSEAGPDGSSPGAALFADNCSSCHGEDGTGMIEVGAPNLTDDFWIYGGDEASVHETVWSGRKGWMPAWEDRLSVAQRKILTVYLQELGAGESAD